MTCNIAPTEMILRIATAAGLLFGFLFTTIPAFAQQEAVCDSTVSNISIPKAAAGGGVEPALLKIFEADQKDRDELMQGDTFHRELWPAVAQHDAARRRVVLRMLQKQKVRSANELYLAAFVFQHGQCPEDFRLASTLAQAAIDRGSEKAKWLYAAAVDRYLLMTNQPQKFGTQFRLGSDGKQELAPLDPTTTDAERAKYNVPGLGGR